MRKLMFARALAVAGVMLISASLAVAGENWVGTWKLNTAKSKFSPGPGPQSMTLKFESTPDGIKLSSQGVNEEGQPIAGGYIAKFDGKEVPVTGNPNADTGAPRKIDDNNYENTWKKGGKVTITTKAVVSPDGKTLTITQSGTNADGKAVSSTVVYEKQ
jgi:hypothetical protein